MKRNTYLWALYDFANSIVMIVFLFYFSQWLVIDNNKPDWWFNASLIVSSVFFILTAPTLSRRLDFSRRKLSGLRVTTVITFLLYLLVALITLFTPTHTLEAAVVFTFALYFYLISFIYYTPMLNDISDAGNRGFVSGLGLGANYAGQVIGLLITLPLATGVIYFFGAEGRAQTLLPATILFGLLAVPLLLWYKNKEIYPQSKKENINTEFSRIKDTFKLIFTNKNLTFLILGYFLFSDALLTFANNFPLFLEKVHGASDSVKTYLTAGILTLSAIGSIIGGKIADIKGGTRTLMWILVAWVVLFPLIAFAPSFAMVIIACLIAGLFFGPAWGVSRSLVSEFSHRKFEASSFGFYILAERFATFIGPIVWSIVLSTTASQGPVGYSYAIFGMAILIFISIFFIRKISPPVLNKVPQV